MWGERNPPTLLVETVWGLLKKLKIELLYEPALSLLGICPKEYK
jgi:hypothetical protein